MRSPRSTSPVVVVKEETHGQRFKKTAECRTPPPPGPLTQVLSLVEDGVGLAEGEGVVLVRKLRARAGQLHCLEHTEIRSYATPPSPRLGRRNRALWAGFFIYVNILVNIYLLHNCVFLCAKKKRNKMLSFSECLWRKRESVCEERESECVCGERERDSVSVERERVYVERERASVSVEKERESVSVEKERECVCGERERVCLCGERVCLWRERE